MTRAAMLIVAVFGLAACGVDGAPRKPVVSGKQTIGVSSGSGAYAKTEIGITFPSN